VKIQAPHVLQGPLSSVLALHDPYCLVALWAILNVELNFLTFLQGLEALALNFTVMNEHITAQLCGNEPETLLVTEPLDGTFCHILSPPFLENGGCCLEVKSRKASRLSLAAKDFDSTCRI
jgi:hypothetical protein